MQENEQVAWKVFDAWNEHDVDRYVTCLSPTTVWESDAFPAPFRGHDGARQFFTLYLTGFPDLHLDVEQMLVATDGHIIVRWRFTGTHRGPLADIPATERRVTIHGCTVTAFAGGTIQHAWVYFDNVSMLKQLGVMPA